MKKKYFMYILAFVVFFWMIVMFISSSLKEDETVTFFPTYGYYNLEGNLVVNIHAWVYEMEENSILRKTLLKTIELSDKEFQNNPLFRKRMGYFLVDNERNKKVNITIAKQNIELPLTKANGHTTLQFTLAKELLDFPNNRILSYQTLEQKSDATNFTGEIHIFKPEGVSVISDIDDTIKDSNVLDKKELLRNTLLKDFVAITGMPQTYKRWAEKGVQFHYVSGSPWQLYPEIEKFFRTEGFPLGSFHLKYFRVKDSSMIKFLKSDQLAYKTKIIENILKDFPKRKYVLVGDSGEKDSEVYAQIAQKYPEQIIAICIRDAGKTGDSAENYQQVFSDVKCKWLFFKDASELENIDKIIK